MSGGTQRADPWDLMALCKRRLALQEDTHLLEGFSCCRSEVIQPGRVKRPLLQQQRQHH